MVDVPTYVLQYALSMVSWRKPVKFRLVMYVLANQRQDPRAPILSQASTLLETGISPTSSHAQYAELVDARVLERIEAAGSRGHAFRVSSRFEEWQVPWLGAREPIGDEQPRQPWILKRNAALAQIDRLLRPPVDHNAAVAARTVARQTVNVARPFARQNPERCANRSATTDGPGARTVARQTSAAKSSTQFPLIEDLSHSLEAREGANKLRAAIRERCGNEVFGSLLTEIVALACDTDTDRAVDAIRRAQPGMSIRAYIEIARGALTTPDLPPPPQPKMWAPPAAEPTAPPPWVTAGLTYQEWLGSCDNGGGGAQ